MALLPILSLPCSIQSLPAAWFVFCSAPPSGCGLAFPAAHILLFLKSFWLTCSFLSLGRPASCAHLSLIWVFPRCFVSPLQPLWLLPVSFPPAEPLLPPPKTLYSPASLFPNSGPLEYYFS